MFYDRLQMMLQKILIDADFDGFADMIALKWTGAAVGLTVVRFVDSSQTKYYN